jgi:hypothetical protein
MSHAHQHTYRFGGQAAVVVAAATMLSIIALLLIPPHAHGNFVYWTNQGPGSTVGRAKINGTGLNDNFITGLSNPQGVAVDSKYVYWAEAGMNRIGRANLDGSGVTPSFVSTGPGLIGVAVNSSGIYWAINSGGAAKIGHADINGGSPTDTYVNIGAGHTACGIAVDQSFVYWLDSTASAIGRAPAGGGAASATFIPLTPGLTGCGIAVDPSFIYWASGNNAIGRAPVGGGTPNESFIPNATPTSLFTHADGVAVNSQYVFWSDDSHPLGSNLIGRANIGGGSPNPSLISGVTLPLLMAAAPSNKITVNSIAKKKKKGTATIDAKVPGPGQVTLNQTNTPPDVNATAASVKQVGLTIGQASSFKLPVKPKGKTAKKLKKQVSMKGRGKVKVKVFIHFVPAGVAGVPNTQQVTVALVKQGKKKH